MAHRAGPLRRREPCGHAMSCDTHFGEMAKRNQRKKMQEFQCRARLAIGAARHAVSDFWQNEADFAGGAHTGRPILRDARLRYARKSALADLRIKMPMSGKSDIGGGLLRMRAGLAPSRPGSPSRSHTASPASRCR